jgi:hypothetical protein
MDYALSVDDVLKIANSLNPSNSDNVKFYTYNELKNVSYPKKGGAYIILFREEPNFGHFTGLLHRNDDTCEFYDPYGILVEREKEWYTKKKNNELDQAQPYLSMIMKNFLKDGGKLEYNAEKMQDEDNAKDQSCGRHVGLRIGMGNLKLDEYNKMIKNLAKQEKENPTDIVVDITNELLGKTGGKKKRVKRKIRALKSLSKLKRPKAHKITRRMTGPRVGTVGTPREPEPEPEPKKTSKKEKKKRSKKKKNIEEVKKSIKPVEPPLLPPRQPPTTSFTDLYLQNPERRIIGNPTMYTMPDRAPGATGLHMPYGPFGVTGRYNPQPPAPPRQPPPPPPRPPPKGPQGPAPPPPPPPPPPPTGPIPSQNIAPYVTNIIPPAPGNITIHEPANIIPPGEHYRSEQFTNIFGQHVNFDENYFRNEIQLLNSNQLTREQKARRFNLLKKIHHKYSFLYSKMNDTIDFLDVFNTNSFEPSEIKYIYTKIYSAILDLADFWEFYKKTRDKYNTELAIPGGIPQLAHRIEFENFIDKLYIKTLQMEHNINVFLNNPELRPFARAAIIEKHKRLHELEAHEYRSTTSDIEKQIYNTFIPFFKKYGPNVTEVTEQTEVQPAAQAETQTIQQTRQLLENQPIIQPGTQPVIKSIQQSAIPQTTARELAQRFTDLELEQLPQENVEQPENTLVNKYKKDLTLHIADTVNAYNAVIIGFERVKNNQLDPNELLKSAYNLYKGVFEENTALVDNFEKNLQQSKNRETFGSQSYNYIAMGQDNIEKLETLIYHIEQYINSNQQTIPLINQQILSNVQHTENTLPFDVPPASELGTLTQDQLAALVKELAGQEANLENEIREGKEYEKEQERERKIKEAQEAESKLMAEFWKKREPTAENISEFQRTNARTRSVAPPNTIAHRIVLWPEPPVEPMPQYRAPHPHLVPTVQQPIQQESAVMTEQTMQNLAQMEQQASQLQQYQQLPRQEAATTTEQPQYHEYSGMTEQTMEDLQREQLERQQQQQQYAQLLQNYNQEQQRLQGLQMESQQLGTLAQERLQQKEQAEKTAQERERSIKQLQENLNRGQELARKLQQDVQQVGMMAQTRAEEIEQIRREQIERERRQKELYDKSIQEQQQQHLQHLREEQEKQRQFYEPQINPKTREELYKYLDKAIKVIKEEEKQHPEYLPDIYQEQGFQAHHIGPLSRFYQRAPTFGHQPETIQQLQAKIDTLEKEAKELLEESYKQVWEERVKMDNESKRKKEEAERLKKRIREIQEREQQHKRGYGKSTEVVSIAFPKDKFTKEQAVDWIKKNNYNLIKIHETKNMYRFRQREYNKNSKHRVKKLNDGVQLTLEF